MPAESLALSSVVLFTSFSGGGRFSETDSAGGGGGGGGESGSGANVRGGKRYST